MGITLSDARLYGSHTFLVVTHSYVSQATHAFLGMLPLCFYYPRAMRCGGDIVTLLWFRPSLRGSVRPSVRGPCEHDRDYTVAYFFVRLGKHVNHNEMMNPIDFGGQRSKVKVTIDIYVNKHVNTMETKPLCAS